MFLQHSEEQAETPPLHPRTLVPSLPPLPPLHPLPSVLPSQPFIGQRQGYIDRLELILYTNIRPWWLGNHVLDLENGTV